MHGQPSVISKLEVDGVEYESFEVVDVARKAAIEVEKTVEQFLKYV